MDELQSPTPWKEKKFLSPPVQIPVYHPYITVFHFYFSGRRLYQYNEDEFFI